MSSCGKVLTGAANVQTLLVNLGNPITLDRDGICAAQQRTGAGTLTINGAGASGGAVALDVRRNVTVYSGGNLAARVFTIKGTWNGVPITRTVTGVNAGTVATTATFDTVTEVSVDATIASDVEVGWGDTLGLPVRLPAAGCVLREMMDGTAPTAGTITAGVNVASATGGLCLASGGPIRCLQIIVTLGGQIRMCDPALAVGDAQACT